MLNSIESWCNCQSTIIRNSGFELSGDKKPAENIVFNCYVAEEITPITDKNGKEYISRTQLYLSATPKVLSSDTVLYEGIAYEIRKANAFRDGNTGEVSIQVIYL